MILIQVPQIDSVRKVITDSIAKIQIEQFNALEFINKIDSFYTSAWTKLAILFALIGVLVPLIINYLQLKRNEKDQEIMKKELLSELKNQIDDYFESSFKKYQHASEGVPYKIQSDIFFKDQRYKESFGDTVNALKCFFIGDDYNNFINTKEDYLHRIKYVSKEDVESLKIELGEYYDAYDLVDKLKKCSETKYSVHYNELYTALKNIS